MTIQHSNLRDPFSGQSIFRKFLEFYAFKIFGKLRRVARLVEKLGVNANYSLWIDSKFGGVTKYKKREEVWMCLVNRISPNKKTVLLEFGVAQGYSTNWWRNRLDEENVTYEIYGFDLFTGLPRSWRSAAAGEFNNGGRAPVIDSPNVHFVIGDVLSTFDTKFLEKFKRDEIQLVVLFDLDLYEPTVFVYSLLDEYLQKGDLVWFDEAFDSDERRVLDEWNFGPNRVEVVGCTALGIGFWVL